MRLWLLTQVVAAAVLAASASAAEIDPGRLVLQRADAPAGFQLDAATTGPSSNAHELAADKEIGRRLLKAGRVAGYMAEFQRGGRGINSRVDVFRRPAGAHTVLLYFDYVLGAQGIKGLRRSRVDLASEAWVYAGPPGTMAVVFWRRGRVIAALATIGLSRSKALELARVQDRRIASSLG
jgi:hypothetical protein